MKYDLQNDAKKFVKKIKVFLDKIVVHIREINFDESKAKSMIEKNTHLKFLY